VAKLLTKLVAVSGRRTALASVAGISVDGAVMQQGDCRDAASARSVLLNPFVDAAICETTLESIVEEGLGFDHCHVAVITGIGEGMKLDLAEWELPEKRTLVYRAAGDVVLPGGAVVMPAGETLGEIVARHCPGSLVLFATDADHPALAAHLAAGGKGFFARGEKIIWRDGNVEIAQFTAPRHEPVEAVLAAVAAASALAVPAAEIERGLS
jgi:cyanophycin synthetase